MERVSAMQIYTVFFIIYCDSLLISTKMITTYNLLIVGKKCSFFRLWASSQYQYKNFSEKQNNTIWIHCVKLH